jgi:hypothetical protein
VVVTAFVLGIWSAAAGIGGDRSDRLPAWGLEVLDRDSTSREVDLYWPPRLPEAPGEEELGPFARIWLPFDAIPPVARKITPSDEPDVSTLEFGRLKLQELRDEPRFFLDAMGAVLFPVTFVAEGAAWLLLPHSISVNGQKILDQDASREDLGTIFVRTFLERELKFLAGLSGSYVATMNVEMGLQEPDQSHFHRLQSRVILDSLKRSYKERYRVPSMDLDTLLETVTTGEWLDFLVVPALFSVYAARYGIDRRFKIDENVRISVHIEKGSRLYKFATSDQGGEIGSVALNLFNLPVSFIVQLEMDHHRPSPGFIGIGTDLGVVVEALYARWGE